VKVYRHQPKGTRFYVLILFSAVLLGLNVMILPGQEELPVKVFTLLLTLAWLAVTIDSLAARVVVEEEGIGIFSIIFKRFTRWTEITEVNFGQKWVFGSFMPEHIVMTYKTDSGQKTTTMTLHNDIKNWKELLSDIVSNAPSNALPGDIKALKSQ